MIFGELQTGSDYPIITPFSLFGFPFMLDIPGNFVQSLFDNLVQFRRVIAPFSELEKEFEFPENTAISTLFMLHFRIFQNFRKFYKISFYYPVYSPVYYPARKK